MHRRSLILVSALALSLTACNSKPPAPAPKPAAQQPHFPARPAVAPPPFKLFHQTADTLTLVSKPDATDDEIAAILWQLRDAAHNKTFDALHIPQSFVDARKPIVWFHVYRGAKCASEKYTSGKLPCDASYHGAGDFTFGDYKNPQWSDGELRHADGSETQLWNPDAPYTPQ